MTPFARQAQAAIAMDTIDMTFDAAAADWRLAELPMTDIQTALSQVILPSATSRARSEPEESPMQHHR